MLKVFKVFYNLTTKNSMSKKKNYCYLGIIFLIFSFYTIYKIFNFNNNYLNFLFVLLTCVSTDIGGYVFGKIFGGTKLTKISPNKTISGAIGSFVFYIFIFYIVLFLYNSFLLMFLRTRKRTFVSFSFIFAWFSLFLRIFTVFA